MMESKTNIDRHAGVPPYIQLGNILRGMIERGQYLPGDRLPSEADLCRVYQVSPMTVRRSIKELLDQRLVLTIQGSGTYVRTPTLGGVTFSLEEFHNIFLDKEQTRVKVLEVLITRADQVTADKLLVKPGERTILIRRLLVRDGDPILYHKEQLIYDPTRPVVEAELEVTSLHGLFVGAEESALKWGELTIEATALSKEEAAALNTIQTQPAFRLEHIFFDLKDKPVSWGQFLCRGDRLKFTARVGIGRGI
jgi:DNA-binding GntR family transcriptional regulator